MGALIGLVLFVGILVSDRWAPWIWAEGNQWWVELGFFGLAILGMLVAQYWRFRKRARFWSLLAILAVIHAVAIVLLVNYVRRIPLGEYMILLPLDAFAMIAFLEWFLHENASSHADRSI